MTEPNITPQPEPTPEEAEFAAAYAAEWKAIQHLAQQNEHGLAALARQGAGLDPVGLIMLRIMLLADFTIGRIEDGRLLTGPFGPRLAYERALQEILARQIAEAQSQVTRHALLQGVPLPTMNGKRVR